MSRGAGSTVRPRIRIAACTLLPLFVSIAPAADIDATTWTRFRGPNGAGTSDLKTLPVAWTSADYEWVRELPGKGHSAPVIWKGKLFVTSGFEDGRRDLICLDAINGKELWSQAVNLGTNKLHLKNSYGSGTPVVDEERVYVVHADYEHCIVTAYDHAGTQVWNVDLGGHHSQHGIGHSPIIVGELLITSNDQDKEYPSAIYALNRRTGERVWSTPRPSRETSYSTPMVLEQNGETRLICIGGSTGVFALDLKDGRVLWQSGELPLRTVSSPVCGDGIVIASCGSGGIGKYLVAVDAAGKTGAPGKVLYNREKELNYVPTPIVNGPYLFLWGDSGVVSCVEIATGEKVWGPQRVGGKYSGSPVLVDGKIYCIAEEGEVVVIEAGPEYKELGRSPLGDESYSTPAVANGRMYLRGFHTLASLKGK